LGDEFLRINGTQAPEVNNGALVTQVDLPPADGLILLRSDLDSHIYMPIVLALSIVASMAICGVLTRARNPAA
jgi:hypothetical protein